MEITAFCASQGTCIQAKNLTKLNIPGYTGDTVAFEMRFPKRHELVSMWLADMVNARM